MQASREETTSFLSILRRLGGFLAIALAGLAISHFTPHGDLLTVDGITRLAGRMGRWGVVVILLAGVLTPLAFLPRWPIACLAGFLYGVTWGTVLSTVASAGGAWLHFALSRSLLAPLMDRLRHRYRLDRYHIPPDKEFLALFLLRAFPLSSFVATNLLAGMLKLDGRRFLAASLLGMIPSSLMYAAWGKLMKKPSADFYLLAVASLVVIVVGAVLAQKVLRRWRAD